MATLTPAQIVLIKLDLGDACGRFTDPQIQAAYDASGSDDCGVRAILWRSVWMSTNVTTKVLGTGQQVSSIDAISAAKDRFDYWNDCWDDGTNAIQVGTLNLAIDTTSADLDNPLASWLYGD